MTADVLVNLQLMMSTLSNRVVVEHRQKHSIDSRIKLRIAAGALSIFLYIDLRVIIPACDTMIQLWTSVYMWPLFRYLCTTSGNLSLFILYYPIFL